MKIKKSAVQSAAARYMEFQLRYGDNNQATQRAEIRYRELKELWEKQNGRKFR